MDLLEYAQRLSINGNNQQQNAQYLQTLIQHSPPKTDDKPSNNTPLLIGGLISLGVFVLVIGYLLGKSRKK